MVLREERELVVEYGKKLSQEKLSVRNQRKYQCI